MRADQIERAAYIAAHAILATNLNAPELACPGARRSFTVDAIASVIRNVFEADRGQLEIAEPGTVRARKVLQVRADPAVRLTPVAGLRCSSE